MMRVPVDWFPIAVLEIDLLKAGFPPFFVPSPTMPPPIDGPAIPPPPIRPPDCTAGVTLKPVPNAEALLAPNPPPKDSLVVGSEGAGDGKAEVEGEGEDEKGKDAELLKPVPNAPPGCMAPVSSSYSPCKKKSRSHRFQ